MRWWLTACPGIAVGSNGHGHSHAERVELAGVIASLLDSAGLDVAVAESLTGGMVASALAEVLGSSNWFRGAVVAYASDVRCQTRAAHRAAWAGSQRASGRRDGRRRSAVTAGRPLTGAAGPDEQDGQPPGTAFLALSDGMETHVEHCYIDCDDPAEVLHLLPHRRRHRPLPDPAGSDVSRSTPGYRMNSEVITVCVTSATFFVVPVTQSVILVGLPRCTGQIPPQW